MSASRSPASSPPSAPAGASAPDGAGSTATDAIAAASRAAAATDAAAATTNTVTAAAATAPILAPWSRAWKKLPPSLRHGRGWMLAAAGALLLLAAFLPPLRLTREVVNHLVVIDITQSMYVADESVDGRSASRLAFVRQTLTDALAHLPCGSQLGLSIFASRRTLLLLAPIDVCDNRVELEQAIAQIDARMAWEDASVIARGVYSATDVAFELAQHPSVLFFTDGQESPPMASIPDFDRPPGRVKGTLVGVGGDAPQPIPRLDKEGRQIGWWSAGAVVQRPTPAGFAPDQEHLSSLHEAHLQALAQTAGLGYARLESGADMVRILNDRRLGRPLVVATDLRWIPALLAGLLMVLYYLGNPGRWAESWRRKRAFSLPRSGRSSRA